MSTDGPATAEEWLDRLREAEGEEYVEENRELLLAQLELMGYR